MRSNLMKFSAMILAAAVLTIAVFSGIGLIFLIDQDMYERTPQQAGQDLLQNLSYDVAYNYALEQMALAEGMTAEETQLLRQEMRYVPYYISDKVLEVRMVTAEPAYTAGVHSFTHVVSDLLYPVALEAGESMPDTDALPVYSDTQEIYAEGRWKTYTLLYYQAPAMTVTVTMSSKTSPSLELVEFVYSLRTVLPVLTVGGAVVGLLCILYLCWAAGKRKGQAEVRPGGLNRLPLDLYTAAVLFLLYFSVFTIAEGLLPGLYSENYELMALLIAAVGFLMCVLAIGWVFAFAAQVKAKGFWWRHSVIGFLLLKIAQGIRWCCRGIRAVFRMLPVVWQWLLTAAGMLLVCCFTGILAFFVNSYIRPIPFFVLLFLAAMLGCVGIILYGGYCFGTILTGAKEMARGNLEHRVNTKYLLAAFRDCGESINALSHAAMESAQHQVKSERMKTELIANVSHDIKTPLTAIISYVDLLQKPHSKEENTEYLEVLSRQCGRLKKLTEDLVEMSKATTGNISAELTPVDACEAVRQALGEFSDKLDAAELKVVLRQPEQPVMIQADGRLTWRVLSNLLSNAVKYAQSGTRLYVDVTQQEKLGIISLKNMSREQLNISADELMERFVRGDASRHTEGSGLGLSIARGLMETQNGALELSVDGDLFKVTLTFPTA